MKAQEKSVYRILFFKYFSIILILLSLSGFFYFRFGLYDTIFPRYKYLEGNFRTQDEAWKYIQNEILKHGWEHDDFSTVQLYGNKNWAAWIIEKAQQGKKLEGCRAGHKAAALEYITNQAPEKKTKSSEAAWLHWWAANKNKKQLEWIQDGFKKYNVKVSIPAKKNEFTGLLRLLGDFRPHNTKEHATLIPSYIKFNAFRWLHASGFDPIKYSLYHKKGTITKEIEKAIYLYTHLQNRQFGKLSLQRNYPERKLNNNFFDNCDDIIPCLYSEGTYRKAVTTAAYLLTGLLLLSGCAILFRLHKKNSLKLNQLAFIPNLMIFNFTILVYLFCYLLIYTIILNIKYYKIMPFVYLYLLYLIPGFILIKFWQAMKKKHKPSIICFGCFLLINPVFLIFQPGKLHLYYSNPVIIVLVYTGISYILYGISLKSKTKSKNVFGTSG